MNTYRASLSVLIVACSLVLGVACGPPSPEDICAKPHFAQVSRCMQMMNGIEEECVNADRVLECMGNTTDLEGGQACHEDCYTHEEQAGDRLREIQRQGR